jgi:hypothetical protein
MKIGVFMQFLTGRRFAAGVTALALLISVAMGGWHVEYPVQVAGIQDQTTVSAFQSGESASQADTEKSKPGANGSQDCASHCEQHGRGLPHTVASLNHSMPTAPKLLALNDNGLAVAQPDGLLEPPKA